MAFARASLLDRKSVLKNIRFLFGLGASPSGAVHFSSGTVTTFVMVGFPPDIVAAASDTASGLMKSPTQVLSFGGPKRPAGTSPSRSCWLSAIASIRIEARQTFRKG